MPIVQSTNILQDHLQVFRCIIDLQGKKILLPLLDRPISRWLKDNNTAKDFQVILQYISRVDNWHRCLLMRVSKLSFCPQCFHRYCLDCQRHLLGTNNKVINNKDVEVGTLLDTYNIEAQPIYVIDWIYYCILHIWSIWWLFDFSVVNSQFFYDSKKLANYKSLRSQDQRLDEERWYCIHLKCNTSKYFTFVLFLQF